MNNRKYYYLISGLPDLIPDDKKLVFTSADIRSYLQNELHPSDFELVKQLYLPWDHDNLVKLMYQEKFEWDIRGNYPRELLEQLAEKKQFDVLDTAGLPLYLVQFVEFFHDDEEDFPKQTAIRYLTEGWYRHLMESGNDFTVEYARYRLNMANIMLALNGRKYDIPFEDAIIGDDDVTYAIKKSRSRDFGLANEINNIETIIQIFETENILDRELRIDSELWQFLDEMTFFNYFTIERVLAFVQKLFIAERWFSLDKERGQHLFNQLLNELQSSFEFPEEFAITYGKRNK
jgi:hypothetical protein